MATKKITLKDLKTWGHFYLKQQQKGLENSTIYFEFEGEKLYFYVNLGPVEGKECRFRVINSEWFLRQLIRGGKNVKAKTESLAFEFVKPEIEIPN